MRIDLEAGLRADGLAEAAAELLARLRLARDLAREEKPRGVVAEERQQPLDIEVQEPGALDRKRVVVRDPVLHFGLTENDDRPAADPQHVLAEPEGDEVGAADRAHQQELERDGHLHLAGVRHAQLRLTVQPGVDAVRQHQQRLDVGPIDELTQGLAGPRAEAGALGREPRAVAPQRRQHRRVGADGVLGDQHQHVGDLGEHLARLSAIAVEVKLQRGRGGLRLDQHRQRADRLE